MSELVSAERTYLFRVLRDKGYSFFDALMSVSNESLDDDEVSMVLLMLDPWLKD